MFHISGLLLLRTWSILLNVAFSICIVTANKCLFAPVFIYPDIANLGLPWSLVYYDMSLCISYSTCKRTKKANCRMLLQIAINMCCVHSATSEMPLATSTWWGFLKSDEFNLASLGIFSCVQTLNLLMKRGLGRTYLPAGLPGGTAIGGHHLKNNSAEHSYSVRALMWSKYNACCSHCGS